MKNYILIGLGLTVAGIIVYKFILNKDEKKSNACGCEGTSNIVSSGKVSASKVSASKYSNAKGGCGCGCGKVGNKVSSNPLGAGKVVDKVGY
jgi:hypothetical protein